MNSTYVFDPLIETTIGNNTDVHWIMIGNWRAALTNASESDVISNTNNTNVNQSIAFFNAAI